jgi:hypothetical protein
VIILQGLSKGKKVQVIKRQRETIQWNKSDKENLENLKSICPDFSINQIEQIYLINEKNFELALNSLLSGEAP